MITTRLLKRLSVQDLRAAIKQKSQLDRASALERKRAKLQKALDRIDRKLVRLNGSSNGAPTRPGRKPGRRKGFKLSAATREKMRLAALRRHRSNGKPATPPAGKRKRRRMSAESRAKMAAAAKARWAKVKGATSP